MSTGIGLLNALRPSMPSEFICRTKPEKTPENRRRCPPPNSSLAVGHPDPDRRLYPPQDLSTGTPENNPRRKRNTKKTHFYLGSVL